MSGHSHWSTIKHKKALVDKRRGKLWSKLSRNLIAAARSGGGDPTMNLALRYAIDKAKAANMPNDTIDRAIARGSGGGEGADFEEIAYEGYAPGGVALLIQALTDNRNRTAPEIKKLLERHGGKLGATGCVAFMFKKKGVVLVAADQADEETLMELAIDAGADDVTTTEDGFEITCEPAAYDAVREALKQRGIETVSAELGMVPDATITVESDPAQKVLGLIEALEEHDDVQNVYSNFDIPAEVMDRVAATS